MYFGFAERHKGLLEDNLTSIFGRPVTIDRLETSWVGWSPALRVQGFYIESDTPNEAALSFDSAAVVVSPSSLFTLWPRFTDFAVERPSLEVVTLPDNKLQIAGITLSGRKNPGISRKRLVSWLLNQSSAAWHDGDIRWRKSDGSVKRYKDISFVYDRQQQSRSSKATITSSKGRVTATAIAQGDLFSSDNWDASVELTSGADQQWVKPGDLSFKVEDGMGRVSLARLNVASIRDFLALSGLTDKLRWVLDAQVSGVLHDVYFTFTGALVDISDWSLKASVSDLGFKSLESLPALNNLSGDLVAGFDTGSFKFNSTDSTFEWSSLYPKSFPVNSAEGRFTWMKNADGDIVASLHQAQFNDPNLSIYDINADLTIASNSQKVSALGDLFTVESINELSFQDGDVVANATRGTKPLLLEASAKFTVDDISVLSGYLPELKKLDKFKQWLTVAFKKGELSNGHASYRGELNRTAMADGKAELLVRGDFDDALVDYAPDFDWPPVTNAKGVATLKNDFLTIKPSGMLLNGDAVADSELTIDNIFFRSALLKLNGETKTSLEKGMAFIFQGPLIPADNRPDVLPVQPTDGAVDIDVALELPLNNIKDLSVNGTATITSGDVILPSGVPLTDINSVVSFTEKNVGSDTITATFLGGTAKAKLITTEQTRPPKMQLKGTGLAEIAALEPWVGEHMLTWFSGQAAWDGTLDIDGSNLIINGKSNLVGVTVSAPEPLAKAPESVSEFDVSIDLGGTRIDGSTPSPSLSLAYNNLLKARFEADETGTNYTAADVAADGEKSADSLAQEQVGLGRLFDRALIQIGSTAVGASSNEQTNEPPRGVNIHIEHPQLNVDKLLESVIDLAQFQPIRPSDNTEFLDAMKSVRIKTPAAVSLSRPFGPLDVNMTTADGFLWNGQIRGDNILGQATITPRAAEAVYTFDLERLIIGPVNEGVDADLDLEPIDKTLMPADYPTINLTVDALRMDGRQLGALDFRGRTHGDQWKVEKFALVHNGIRTAAAGGWTNDQAAGSLSSFDFNTMIDEAEGALSDMDFEGYIRKGRGSMGGTLEWAGAPHEFDYSRLNGKFDLFVKDGELVQVEPGSGKLVGLLNFNTIARRLVFDFRDVFASGLQFDRMRYRGLLSNGDAILQDAFILTPAVFVRMEGKLSLDQELIDMDVHISPELGGNLTLLSALANPTAGAVVFLTSQIFKDDMRRASFKSYQAKGTWEDFEMVEIDSEGNPLKAVQKTPEQRMQGDYEKVETEPDSSSEEQPEPTAE